MAKVYTGKVAIPGDKIGEYFKLMEEAQKQREPFRCHLVELNKEFHKYLLAKYSEKTARKYSTIIDLFIDFICWQTDADSIEEITKGMVNTHFKQWWKRKVWDSTTPDQLKTALKKFFIFLATEKGIVNHKVFGSAIVPTRHTLCLARSTYQQLYNIYKKYQRKYKHNPDSKQMCCMWSTCNPPDTLCDTKQISEIEKEFRIELTEEEAVDLYDMDLKEAAKWIDEKRCKVKD